MEKTGLAQESDKKTPPFPCGKGGQTYPKMGLTPWFFGGSDPFSDGFLFLLGKKRKTLQNPARLPLPSQKTTNAHANA